MGSYFKRHITVSIGFLNSFFRIFIECGLNHYDAFIVLRSLGKNKIVFAVLIAVVDYRLYDHLALFHLRNDVKSNKVIFIFNSYRRYVEYSFTVYTAYITAPFILAVFASV